MSADPFPSLADMDRRFVSSNRRSTDRRRRQEWRGSAARRITTALGVVLTVLAGGYALSRLDLSIGGEAPAAAAAQVPPRAPLSGCALPAALRADFASAAKQARLPPALLVAVAHVESRLDPGARSAAGAEGLLQLLPSTARELGLDPSLQRQNVLAGALYLRRMLDRFKRVDLALAAYNAGPGAVARNRHRNAETVAYVANVQRRAAGLTACR